MFFCKKKKANCFCFMNHCQTVKNIFGSYFYGSLFGPQNEKIINEIVEFSSILPFWLYSQNFELTSCNFFFFFSFLQLNFFILFFWILFTYCNSDFNFFGNLSLHLTVLFFLPWNKRFLSLKVLFILKFRLFLTLAGLYHTIKRYKV